MKDYLISINKNLEIFVNKFDFKNNDNSNFNLNGNLWDKNINNIEMNLNNMKT